MKVRTYVTPSSLGSYFGVGFLSPEEQFLIDSGQEKATFDDDAKLRMALGNHLEDATINYFQDEVFKVPITDRNTEVKFGYDDKIRYKIDGIIHLGEPAIFENKISNARSGRFTDNKGYHIQIQSYMLCEGLNKSVLAGLYQGKPIYKMIDRDEEMIADIKRMTDFIVNALNGLVDFYEEFPVDLLEKYSNSKLYEPIDNLSAHTVSYLHELAKLNAEKKVIEDKIKALNNIHENDFEIDEGVYEDDNVLLRVSKFTQKGRFDVDELRADFPYIDLDKYYGEPVVRTRRTLKLKDPLS